MWCGFVSRSFVCAESRWVDKSCFLRRCFHDPIWDPGSDWRQTGLLSREPYLQNWPNFARPQCMGNFFVGSRWTHWTLWILHGYRTTLNVATAPSEQKREKIPPVRSRDLHPESWHIIAHSNTIFFYTVIWTKSFLPHNATPSQNLSTKYEQNRAPFSLKKCCPQNLVLDALCALRYFRNQAQITKNNCSKRHTNAFKVFESRSNFSVCSHSMLVLDYWVVQFMYLCVNKLCMNDFAWSCLRINWQSAESQWSRWSLWKEQICGKGRAKTSVRWFCFKRSVLESPEVLDTENVQCSMKVWSSIPLHRTSGRQEIFTQLSSAWSFFFVPCFRAFPGLNQTWSDSTCARPGKRSHQDN